MRFPRTFTKTLVVLPMLLLAAPTMAQTSAHNAADPDAVCEATFTALSANARAQGLSSAALDQGADAAHRAWISSHPGRDAGAYRTAVKVRAASLRQAMADGRVTLAETMGRLVNCHTRYHTNQMVASLD